MMKTFEELYLELQTEENQELARLWNKIKQERKYSLNKVISTSLLVDILLLIISILISLNVKYGEISFMVSIVYGAFINFFLYKDKMTRLEYSNTYNELNKEYKKQVIKKLINNFYTDVNYCLESEIIERIVEQFKVDGYLNYSPSDCFEGKLDCGNVVEILDAIGVEDVTQYSKNNNIIRGIGYGGLIQRVELDNNIDGIVNITMLPLGGNAELDNSEFEKLFNVTSSDKVLAYRVLNSEVTEILVEFFNKVKMKFDISVKDNRLYIKYYSGNLFEIDINKTDMLDKESIRKSFYMLNFTRNIANKLIVELSSISK